MPLKCPLCGSRDLTAFETLTEIEVRQVINGRMTEERIDHEPGESLKWEAECDRCMHRWTPRRSTIEAAQQKD